MGWAPLRAFGMDAMEFMDLASYRRVMMCVTGRRQPDGFAYQRHEATANLQVMLVDTGREGRARLSGEE